MYFEKIWKIKKITYAFQKINQFISYEDFQV